MSDDDDFEELPPISVNSSSSDSRSFIMPGAGEVAEARARAAHCERQLLLLRAEHEAAVTAPTTATAIAIAQHSDSSGSEGEAALAAAVASLRVKRAAVAAPDHATLLALAVEAAGELASLWLQRYLHAVERGSERGRRRLAEHTLAELSAAARAADEWSREDAFAAALWTLTATAAAPSLHPTLPRAHLSRLVHCLLDDILNNDQVEAMVCALEAAVCTWSGARVEVCDVLRGGGVRCRKVACRLLAGGEGAGAGAAERYAALQLVGRALAGEGAAPSFLARDLARRLDTLAPKHSHPTPDELKVLVAASKIRVLFDIGR